MKYYIVAEVNVTDARWVPEYLTKVNRIVESYGGKYLARTPQLTLVEGDARPHQTAIIMEFPSKEAAEGFYYSEEYKPQRKARQKGSFGKLYFVAGEDTGKD